LGHGGRFDDVNIVTLRIESFPEIRELAWKDKGLREEVVLLWEQLSHLLELPGHFGLVSQSKDPWELRDALVSFHLGHELRGDCSVDPDDVEVFIARLNQFSFLLHLVPRFFDRVKTSVILIIVQGLSQSGRHILSQREVSPFKSVSQIPSCSLDYRVARVMKVNQNFLLSALALRLDTRRLSIFVVTLRLNSCNVSFLINF